MVRFNFFCVMVGITMCSVLTNPQQLLAESGSCDRLISALILKESSGNDEAIGDKHLKNKAYGPLQIRQPAVDDYNRWHGTKLKAEDCLGNRKLSVAICESYLAHYATEKRLGRTPTDQDRARIWNGGPNGYKKESTEKYWCGVKRILESL